MKSLLELRLFQVLTVAGELTSQDFREDLMKKTLKKFGKLDVLVSIYMGLLLRSQKPYSRVRIYVIICRSSSFRILCFFLKFSTQMQGSMHQIGH